MRVASMGRGPCPDVVCPAVSRYLQAMGVIETKAKTRQDRQDGPIVEMMGRGKRPLPQATAVADGAVAFARDVDELRAKLERLLPWRSADGTPLGMAVVDVGYLSAGAGSRPAGCAYSMVSADSFDAAAELRRVLAPVAGLTDDEWRTGWFETTGRLFGIRIYPTF